MAPQGVDTSIHHETTGLAAKLASQHSEPASSGLTLYSGWFCPFVQRVWILLEEKSIPYRYIEINPYKKEAHFLTLNPRGLVPTLAIAEPLASIPTKPPSTTTITDTINGTPVHEKILYESLVILNYLNTTHPSPPLYPSDPYASAISSIWIDHVATRIIPSFYRFLQHTPSSTYTLTSAREEFTSHLLTYISAADSTGPYFNGAEISMADIVLIPWAKRIFLIDHYKTGGSGVPTKTTSGNDGGDASTSDDPRWARWLVWYEAISSRPSVQNTLSDRERYIEVYQRYAEDTTGSQVGQATRGGRGLP